MRIVWKFTWETKNNEHDDWHCVENLKYNVPYSFVDFAMSDKRKPWLICKLNTDSVSGSAWEVIYVILGI
jgi:hypothetical protein